MTGGVSTVLIRLTGQGPAPGREAAAEGTGSRGLDGPPVFHQARVYFADPTVEDG